jgi:FtsZ family, C-terminal domain
MLIHSPIWHEVEPLEKDQTRFVIANLEADELALPIIQSPEHAIAQAHAMLAVSHGGDDIPHELIAATKRGVVTAVLRNDVATAKIAVTDIVHVFTRLSYMGIDFEDLRAILASSTNHTVPHAVAGSGTARSHSTCMDAFDMAIGRAELEHTNCLRNSGGVLLIISASQHHLRLHTGRAVINALRLKVDPEALLLYGINFDESIGDTIRITVLAAV